MSSWSQGAAPADLLGVQRVPRGCDTTYSDRSSKQKAHRAARRDRPSAAHRDRRWASRSTSLRRSRQASGSATSTGAVLAGLVDERAAGDVRGAGALLWGRSSVESRPDRRWSRGVRPPPPWGRCTRLVRPWAAVGASCGPKAHAWLVGVWTPCSARHLRSICTTLCALPSFVMKLTLTPHARRCALFSPSS